jgi:hypothetical protein
VVFADHQALVGKWAIETGVQTIDVRNRSDSSGIAAELAGSVKEARALPRLESGVDLVASQLLNLLA